MENNTSINDEDIICNENDLIFDPYNPKNKEITKDEVENILKRYGIYTNINNIELYKRAFVHRSYTKRPNGENEKNNITIAEKPVECISLKTKSNERLEFLGDGVLELITKYYLYRRFPKADEGFMTEKKIAIVKNEHIGRLAYEMRLQNWLLISKTAEEKNIRTNLKKLGCLFEAFIGAIFLDFNKIEVNDEEGWFQNIFVTGPGFQMAQIFVERVLEEHVDWMNLIQNNDNYKNILQVKIQKEFKITPDYLEISHDDNGFNVGVYLCLGCSIHNMKHEDAIHLSNYGSFQDIKDILGIHSENNQENTNTLELQSSVKLFILLGTGTHKVKKKAEQLACVNALQTIDN